MVLCIGTTPAVQRTMTFPTFIVDEVNRAAKVLESAAGKVTNAARVLHLLDVPVMATGFLGGDSGRFIRSELDRDGVPHNFVEVPFRTRTCTTIIDHVAGTTTELVEESEPVEARYWDELERLIVASLPKSRAMVISGSLPPNSPQDFYARCCERAKRQGIPMILDLRGEPLRLAMKHNPTVVKPNRSELASTFSLKVESDDDLRLAIRRLVELGTKSALITMGAQGAIFSDGESYWAIPAPTVKLNNPIGSGDSVAAGFTAGLLKGLPPLECAKLGVACGSANALTPVPGLLDKPDVERLLGEIEVKPW